MPRPDPPAEYRWKPGQTGNPNGHSRGRRVTSALIALIEEKGADKALAARWLQEALKGDPKFFAMLLDRVEGKVPDKVKVETEEKKPRIVPKGVKRRDGE